MLGLPCPAPTYACASLPTRTLQEVAGEHGMYVWVWHDVMMCLGVNAVGWNIGNLAWIEGGDLVLLFRVDGIVSYVACCRDGMR